MIITILAFLTVISGFYKLSNGCQISVDDYCRISEYNFNPPTTEEELSNYCNNGKELLRCVIDYGLKCGMSSNLSNIIQIEAKVYDVCDEDNILYQAVSENINCIGNVLGNSNFVCPEIVDKGMEKVIAEKGFSTQLEDEFKCSSSLFFLSCLITNIRQLCGQIPANATLEVSLMFRLPLHCNPEIAEQLPTIVQTIQLIEQEENELENTRKKK